MGVQRIAVLGGGMASLVTAYELTCLEDWKDRYEITVYQQGWRLGGKGASGRGVEHRIEEHGLHLLFGSYENSFRILRACYAWLAETGSGWTFADAFKGSELVVMWEKLDDRWEPWDLPIGPTTGQPGTGDPVEMTPMGILRAVVDWLIARTHDLIQSFFSTPPQRPGTQARSLNEAIALLRKAGALASAKESADDFNALSSEDLEGLIERIRGLIEKAAAILRALEKSAEVEPRRRRIVADFGFAAVIGVLREGALFPRPNWFVLDDYEFRSFLAKYGAEPETLASAVVHGCYDAIFSADSRAAAGTVLHGLCRSLLRRGHIFYRMQAGMGDVVFAPLYQLLLARGVRFQFFHRVEELQLSDDRRKVERIIFDRQVELRDSSYHPLVPVCVEKDDGSRIDLPCWPSQPDRSQMKNGDDTEGHDLEDWWDPWRGKPLVLERGRCFDLVVLGISIGALRDICRDLAEDPDNPRFADMLMSVQTTQTQALQLWMTKSLSQLGHPKDPPVSIPFERPFDTWADMSHLLPRERVAEKVHNIAYMCSSLVDLEPLPPRSDHGYAQRQRRRVWENAESWLDQSARWLWPSVALANGCFDRNLLHPFGAQGDQLAAQHYCATVNPSDRYVLAVPGSSRKRLRADESGYDNLFLTGDWILTSFSAGCLEAATMAGMQAARAIDSRVPKPAHDWLPERNVPGGPPASGGGERSSYVIRDGEMLVVPPVGLTISMNMFFVRADPARLIRLCNNHLNRGGTRRYRPVGPFVVFYCADMDNVVPSGNIRELDFGIWVPVYAGRGEGGSFEARQIMTYTPYLWVDNSPALVGGRAVFGFPKHIGNMRMPASDEPAMFSCGTYVTRLPSGRAEELRLLKIARRGRSAWRGHNTSWQGEEEVEGVLELLVGSLEHLPEGSLQLVRQLLQPEAGMPSVFFKELPEVDGTWDAAYQAIIEGAIDITGGRRSGPLDRDYEVSLLECWSHDIVGTLGLRVDRREPGSDGMYSVMSTIANTWMEFDARVQPGKIVWKAL